MPQAPPLYTAFGLNISSEIPLIDLPAATGAADVVVAFGNVAGVENGGDSWVVAATPEEVRGWAAGAGAFRVSGGREITIDPATRYDDRAMRLAIVGPLLGVILGQRGAFVLHASTVAIDERAVAFFGPSGRGKSTLSAAFVKRGHRLIADDMTVIDPFRDVPVVQPGFPRVKLWPDSAAALDHDTENLPLIHPERTKRSLQLFDQFDPAAIPLARCYLLDEGATDAISELSPSETILSLVRCTYQSQWLRDTGSSGSNLLQCGALARSGVVRRLQRRKSFEALEDVMRFVIDDVTAR
jgi:hypothetical protein